MSGYTDRAIVHHGILDQDIAFIGKPFTPDALVLKVVEILNQNERFTQSIESISRFGTELRTGRGDGS